MKNIKENKELSKNLKDDSDEILSKWHSLYKTKVEEKYIKGDDDKYTLEPSYNKYRIFIDLFWETEKGLHKMQNELWDAGSNDELEIHIASNGGIIHELMQFHNIITNKFNNKTTTILDSYGYSCGAMLFCMGSKRVVTPTSEIMFHNFSGGFRGKGHEIESHYKHTKKHLKSFFRAVLVDGGFFSEEMFKDFLNGSDYWMGAEEMCKLNIASHVLYNGKEIKAKKYLKILKKNKK